MYDSLVHVSLSLKKYNKLLYDRILHVSWAYLIKRRLRHAYPNLDSVVIHTEPPEA